MSEESNSIKNVLLGGREGIRSRRLLLFENSEAEEFKIRSLLFARHDYSYRIYGANDLSSGFIELRRGGYDLLILDLSLPEFDDIGTLKELFRMIDFPVLVLCTPESVELAAAAKELGAEDYLDRTELHGLLLEKSIEHAIERFELKRELRYAKQETVAASKAKNDFLSIMSHEIRTPMNGVIGGLSLLQDFKFGKEVSSIIELVKKSADNHLSLIDDLLEMASLERGRVDIALAPFNLRNLLDAVLDHFGYIAEVKGIDLSYTLGEEVDDIVCSDERRVRQVLVNLVGNALKFIDDGEVGIFVSCESGRRLVFSVVDTGIGISQINLRKIFDVFSQVDATLSRAFDGVGMGLAACKRIIDAMNGTIDVSSCVGVGSEFTFSIDVGSSNPFDRY